MHLHCKDRSAQRHIYAVYCNGKKLQHCYEADSFTGRAWCYKTDANGHICRDGDDVARVMYTGKVRFKRSA